MKIRRSIQSLVLPMAFVALATGPDASAQVSVSALVDGGFEQGPSQSAWVEASTRGRTLIKSGGPASGPFAGRFRAELGGSNNETDSLSQDVIVPIGASGATLSFWYNVRATGNSNADPDLLRVSIRRLDQESGRVVHQLTSQNDTGDRWIESPHFDVTAEAGGVVRVTFSSVTGKNQPTSFYLDDVRLSYTPGTTAEARSVSFVRPSGCIGIDPPRLDEPYLVSGVVPLVAVATDPTWPSSLSVTLNGRVRRSAVSNNLVTTISEAELSLGDNVIEAAAIGSDGLVRRCPIIVRARPILANGSFDDGTNTISWRSETTASGRSLFLSGLSPRPLSGDYAARFGGISGLTESISQVVRFPSDMSNGSLSFYYRVLTTRSGSTSDDDTLRVQLTTSTGVTLPTLLTLSNLAATPVDGSYQLATVEIPTAAFGTTCTLSFSSKIAGGNPARHTTFIVDDVGLWLSSSILANAAPGQVAVIHDDSNGTCAPNVLAVSTAVNVDTLSLFKAGTAAPVALCQNCNAIPPISVPVPTNECGEYFAVAERDALYEKSASIFVPGRPGLSAPCSTDSTQPATLISGIAAGTTISGDVFISGRATDAFCVTQTALLVDGSVAKVEFGSQVSLILDSKTLGDGPHTFSVTAIDAAGNLGTGLLGQAKVTAEVDNCTPPLCSQQRRICATANTATLWEEIDVDLLPDSCHSCAASFGVPSDRIRSCLKRAVGRLWIKDLGYVCTGVLVRPGHFLTSGQCMSFCMAFPAACYTANGSPTENVFVEFPEAESQRIAVTTHECGGLNGQPSGFDKCQQWNYPASAGNDWAVLTLKDPASEIVPIASTAANPLDDRGFVLEYSSQTDIITGTLRASFSQVDASNCGSLCYRQPSRLEAGSSPNSTASRVDADSKGAPVFSYDGQVFGVGSILGNGYGCNTFAKYECANGDCGDSSCTSCNLTRLTVDTSGSPAQVWDRYATIGVDSDPEGFAYRLNVDGSAIAVCVDSSSAPTYPCTSNGATWDSAYRASNQVYRVTAEDVDPDCNVTSDANSPNRDILLCHIGSFVGGLGYYGGYHTIVSPRLFSEDIGLPEAEIEARYWLMNIRDSATGALLYSDSCSGAGCRLSTEVDTPASGEWTIDLTWESTAGCRKSETIHKRFHYCSAVPPASIGDCRPESEYEARTARVAHRYFGLLGLVMVDVTDIPPGTTVTFGAVGPFGSEFRQACVESACVFAWDVAGYPEGDRAFSITYSDGPPSGAVKASEEIYWVSLAR